MELAEYLAQVDQAYESLSGPGLEARLQSLRWACRSEYGLKSGPYAAMLNELGAFYKGQGKLEDAEGCFREAVDLLGEVVGRMDQAYATARNNLAGVHRMQGRLREAEQEFSDCLSLYGVTVGKDSLLYASGLNNLSLVWLDRGDLDRAAQLQEQAAEILRTLPQCRDELAVSLCNLGVLLQRLGRLGQAEEKLTAALEMFRGELGTDTPHYHATLNAMGAVCYTAERYREAEEYFRAAAEAAENLYGSDHWEARAAWEHVELARRSVGESL